MFQPMCLYSQNKGQVESSFEEESLVMSLLDLFVAGSQTTTSTLRWAVLYMANNPEIQGKSPD